MKKSIKKELTFLWEMYLDTLSDFTYGVLPNSILFWLIFSNNKESANFSLNLEPIGVWAFKLILEIKSPSTISKFFIFVSPLQYKDTTNIPNYKNIYIKT